VNGTTPSQQRGRGHHADRVDQHDGDRHRRSIAFPSARSITANGPTPGFPERIRNRRRKKSPPRPTGARGRLDKPADLQGTLSEADEGTRTLDLLHGKHLIDR
jgi:hypothetical protein